MMKYFGSILTNTKDNVNKTAARVTFQRANTIPGESALKNISNFVANFKKGNVAPTNSDSASDSTAKLSQPFMGQKENQELQELEEIESTKAESQFCLENLDSRESLNNSEGKVSKEDNEVASSGKQNVLNLTIKQPVKTNSGKHSKEVTFYDERHLQQNQEHRHRKLKNDPSAEDFYDYTGKPQKEDKLLVKNFPDYLLSLTPK